MNKVKILQDKLQNKKLNSNKNKYEEMFEEADKIIFLVDGKDGINPIDYDIANILRRASKPMVLSAAR